MHVEHMSRGTPLLAERHSHSGSDAMITGGCAGHTHITTAIEDELRDTGLGSGERTYITGVCGHGWTSYEDYLLRHHDTLSGLDDWPHTPFVSPQPHRRRCLWVA